MELRESEDNALEEYASHYDRLIGDRRTRRTFNAVLQGIIGSESLRCAQIAAFSPGAKCAEMRREESQALGERGE